MTEHIRHHPKDVQHGADDNGSYADVRNIRGCLKANPMYGQGAQQQAPDEMTKPIGKLQDHPKEIHQHGADDTGSYADVRNIRGCLKANPMYGAQNEELYMCPDTPNTPEGAETPRVSYREVTERDANQPAVMLGSGLTRPAPPLPPPRNLAPGEQVTVSGPEQNEELHMCPDTPNTPEGTDDRGDDDAGTPRVSYRDRAMGMWNKMKSSKVCRLLMGCGFVIGTVALVICLTPDANTVRRRSNTAPMQRVSRRGPTQLRRALHRVWHCIGHGIASVTASHRSLHRIGHCIASGAASRRAFHCVED
uniref:Uncharacterized protein n=1 Tax=Branchiostoma floridae TaxID=7739 RepID=C4A0K1_BRAFL|eukprot:XP_002585672.1 hypothetical protein BRAFLDRAFT_111578 [Branchiostoma floridae]